MEVINHPIKTEYVQEGDSHCPKVILDKKSNKFEFSGISIPNNTEATYFPIIQWLKEYKGMPNPDSEVVFKLDFIDLKSSEMIKKIIEIFDDINSNGHRINIKWYYHIDDEDMRIEGRHYSNLYSLPFELINYKN